jgi:hypothetical protein
VTYLPLVVRVLSLRRPPDREVPLDQPLLQVVPLRDRRVVVLQHFYPVLQLHKLLLREMLDLPRF